MDESRVLLRLKHIKSCGDAESNREELWSILNDDKLRHETRFFASLLYIGSGIPIYFYSSQPVYLLLGAISKLQPENFRCVVTWLLDEQATLDINIYSGFMKVLQQQPPKISPDGDDSLNAMIRKLSKRTLRMCLMHSTVSFDSILHSTILDIQCRYGVSAIEQFYWISQFHFSLKLKYHLLSHVISRLSQAMLLEVETSICNQLWLSQCDSELASLSSDCFLAWSKATVGVKKSIFPEFMIDSLTSTNKMRRMSTARFLLIRLTTLSSMKCLLERFALELLEMLENQQNSCLISVDDYREVTCVDFEWKTSDDEDDVWSLTDRILYAWTCTQLAFVRFGDYTVDTNTHLRLVDCLRSFQSIVRCDAFRVVATQKSCDMGMEMCEFIVDNLPSDDSNLQSAIINYIDRLSPLTIRELQRRLLSRLHSCDNSRSIALSLEILLKSKIKLESDELGIILSFIVDENSSIRNLAVELLPECIDELRLQRIMNIVDSDLRKNSYSDSLSCLILVLIRYCPSYPLIKNIFRNYFDDSDYRRFILNVLMRQTDLCGNFMELFEYCLEKNEMLLKKSGSDGPGECPSLVKLTERIHIVANDVPLLSVESLHCKNYADLNRLNSLNRFYIELKTNCQLLVLFCTKMEISTENFLAAYESLWNVMIRSYHKGIIDHVSDCFEKITRSCLSKELLKHSPGVYITKTLAILTDSSTTVRNLSLFRIIKVLVGNCYDEVAELILSLLNHITYEDFEVTVRVLKIVKNFLSHHDNDLSRTYSNITQRLLFINRSSKCVVRSASAHCFAVLLNRIFERNSFGYPLFLFIAKQGDIWHFMCDAFLSTEDGINNSTILFLSFINGLRLIDPCFYSDEQFRFVVSISKRLICLMLTSENVRINLLIIDCLIKLNSNPKRLLKSITDLMTQRSAQLDYNQLYTLDYAMKKIANEYYDVKYDTSYRPAAPPTLSHIDRIYTYSAETSQFDIDRYSKIESEVLSCKELRRLIAAHNLNLIAKSLCSSHRDFCCSLFFHVCILLTDEVLSIRRIASRILIPLTDDSQWYSLSPRIVIKKLIEKMAELGISKSNLLNFWQLKAKSTLERRKRFNSFINDSFIENLLIN